jgi:UDP:flavonoid glycosyltransferase YjiC (YdhE family)
MSFGVPLVCAGLAEHKADVNVRVGWTEFGINLETNAPTPQALRTVLDADSYRLRASRMGHEFRMTDTRGEILLGVVAQVLRNSCGRGDFACGLYVENDLPFRR